MRKTHATYFYPFTTKCVTRNQRSLKVCGRALRSEHELVRNCTPAWTSRDVSLAWTGGHMQPREYVLDGDRGYTSARGWDDTEADVMRAHMRLLHHAGINTVIFNAYGGFKGTGKAREFACEMLEPISTFASLIEKTNDMQFALNICLSSPRVVFPVPLDSERAARGELRKDYELSPESIEMLFTHLANKYLIHPSYLRYRERPVLLIYDAVKITRMDDNFTMTTLQETIKRIRTQGRCILGEDIFLAGLVFKPSDAIKAEEAGFDAISSYILLPEFDSAEQRPVQNYAQLLEKVQRTWQDMASNTSLPFYPSAVPGWDAWPRCEQSHNVLNTRGSYPYTPIVVNNRPVLFGEMLRRSMAFISEQRDRWDKQPLFDSLIACWNEMSEGCSIIPSRFDCGTLDSGFLNTARAYLKG